MGSAPFPANRSELLIGKPKCVVLAERVTRRLVTATELGEQLLEVGPSDEALHRNGHHLGDVNPAPDGLAAGGFQHSLVYFDR